LEKWANDIHRESRPAVRIEEEKREVSVTPGRHETEDFWDCLFQFEVAVCDFRVGYVRTEIGELTVCIMILFDKETPNR